MVQAWHFKSTRGQVHEEPRHRRGRKPNRSAIVNVAVLRGEGIDCVHRTARAAAAIFPRSDRPSRPDSPGSFRGLLTRRDGTDVHPRWKTPYRSPGAQRKSRRSGRHHPQAHGHARRIASRSRLSRPVTHGVPDVSTAAPRRRIGCLGRPDQAGSRTPSGSVLAIEGKRVIIRVHRTTNQTLGEAVSRATPRGHRAARGSAYPRQGELYSNRNCSARRHTPESPGVAMHAAAFAARAASAGFRDRSGDTCRRRRSRATRCRVDRSTILCTTRRV